jgi:hypothetical protein
MTPFAQAAKSRTDDTASKIFSFSFEFLTDFFLLFEFSNYIFLRLLVSSRNADEALPYAVSGSISPV